MAVDSIHPSSFILAFILHPSSFEVQTPRYNQPTMTATIQPETKPAPGDQQAVARHFVNFMFFSVDRAFRSEPLSAKVEAKRELAAIVHRHTGPMMVLPYSPLGLKPAVDFMLCRIWS